MTVGRAAAAIRAAGQPAGLVPVLRSAVVDTVSPLAVFIGGDTTSVPAAALAEYVPTSGDTVTVLDVPGGQPLVIGSTDPTSRPGRVALTRVTSGSQSTVSGAERLWASLQTATPMVSGRVYKLTVAVSVDSVTADTPADIRVRNSKSASAPTTSSAQAAIWRTTPHVFAEDRTFVDEYTADTTGTNTLGVSVATASGTTETSIGAFGAASLLVEDIT